MRNRLSGLRWPGQFISFAAAISLGLIATPLDARPFRVGQIPNGSVNRCANCHVNSNGGGVRNAFGQDVEARLIDGNVDWGPVLAALDSDGDDVLNGQELQDSEGTWRSGQEAPGSASLVSRPGDAGNVPPPTNAPPELSAIGALSVGEGDTLRIDLVAVDADGDSLTFGVTGAPAEAQLLDALFIWIPTFEQAGEYGVTFTVDDGRGGVDQETAVLNVEDRSPPLTGDFDMNGRVDFDDFFLFADAFGGTDPRFDLNGNGRVDFDDFFLFADNFGKRS